ncbi:MAG TPA: hypothetical protein VK151_00515 [Fluviicola sp.]|nr:hypothetical protein [Fluviicola sp.]
MKKPILSLPCNMHLDDFTQREKGYHCAQCDKVLKDFRDKSNDEIIATIRSTPGRVCGIFTSDQYDFKVSQVTLPRLTQSVGLSLLGILGFLGSVVTSCETVTKETAPIRKNAFNKLKFPMHVTGTLRDEKTKEPIANAWLELQQNGKTIRKVYTDEHGYFDFTIKKGDLVKETFDLLVDGKHHDADTLRNQSALTASHGRKISLTLKASVSKCEKNVQEVFNVPNTIEGDVIFVGVEDPTPPEEPLDRMETPGEPIID